ncbi:hypothetical protein GTQ99_02390 [Kineococcus sp. T13]|uniref:hypothetical protein n=1 Tax=Kineococcus vitellinus TaxID=2696565 RepID=UPI001412ACC0|nr:hypothetical protein [Kineococcus vitellinus]NAZ74277.1 hypothetical protein [Kineococcus vitellinus]
MITYVGLLTQVDGSGYVKDRAAVFNAVLWPGRGHTVEEMEEELEQLTTAGLLCRFGALRGYLHIVDHAVQRRGHRHASRKLPSCPTHHRALTLPRQPAGSQRP